MVMCGISVAVVARFATHLGTVVITVTLGKRNERKECMSFCGKRRRQLEDWEAKVTIASSPVTISALAATTEDVIIYSAGVKWLQWIAATIDEILFHILSTLRPAQSLFVGYSQKSLTNTVESIKGCVNSTMTYSWKIVHITWSIELISETWAQRRPCVEVIQLNDFYTVYIRRQDAISNAIPIGEAG